MHATIRMTLTGPKKGQTIKLNGHQFINGQCEFTGQPEAVQGVMTYFTRSYQVKVDSAIEGMSIPVVQEVTSADPNDRQKAIIEAVNTIEKDQWVDASGKKRPKVKDVADLMNDPTVKAEEIIEVIEKWLS